MSFAADTAFCGEPCSAHGRRSPVGDTSPQSSQDSELVSCSVRAIYASHGPSICRICRVSAASCREAGLGLRKRWRTCADLGDQRRHPLSTSSVSPLDHCKAGCHGFIHAMHIAERNDCAECAQKDAFYLSEIDKKYSNFLRLKNNCRFRILTNPAVA